MNKKGIASVCLVLIIVVGILYIFRPVKKTTPIVMQARMTLTSSAFENTGNIPKQFTCDGEKIHPPLSISNVSASAKSLAFIVDDPDAPNGTFNHWVIWNIDPLTKEIAEGGVPQKSQEGTNSAGGVGYTPPCPPSGRHRYFFTVYALDEKLGLDGKATKADVEKSMSGHVLSQSLLVGVVQ